MSNQSDILRDYRRRTAQTQKSPEDISLYLRNELDDLSRSINLLVQVVKEIDARLVAHGI